MNVLHGPDEFELGKRHRLVLRQSGGFAISGAVCRLLIK
jgi:hypothetical protein